MLLAVQAHIEIILDGAGFRVDYRDSVRIRKRDEKPGAVWADEHCTWMRPRSGRRLRREKRDAAYDRAFREIEFSNLRGVPQRHPGFCPSFINDDLKRILRGNPIAGAE